MPNDKPSSSFRIKPLTPMKNTGPNLAVLAITIEHYRLRNARMRRGLRIGFRRVEMGDNTLEPIDFVHKDTEYSVKMKE
jgi:hypothetical protein